MPEKSLYQKISNPIETYTDGYGQTREVYEPKYVGALRKAYNPDLLEDFDENLVLDYVLPQKHIPIETFRGSVLDMEELHYLVEHSGALDEMFENQHVEKIGESSTRPLLPFNIGQIGLILSSGSLDGVVEEGNGVCHVIKGMTIKETDTVTEQSTENGRIMTQSTDTVRNKVQITALGADGTFYNLT